MDDRRFVEFLEWALPRLELRWAGFRKVRRQVRRRLSGRLRDLGLDDLEAYRAQLEAEPGEWAVLDRLCRVTISRFFRDRGVWVAVEEAVLPNLAERALEQGTDHLRAWSAGCASGEEPYSLSILWQGRLVDRYPGLTLRVLATDRDLTLLARARRAVYPEGALREADVLGHHAAFAPTADGEWQLESRYRRGVGFAALEIRSDAAIGRFDLVFCRNLAFTYFAEGLQRRVLDLLLGRLAPGGVLVIGSHEQLPGIDSGRPSSDTRLEALGLFRF